MKKLIVALVAILIVAALAFTYIFVINNPEKQIIGKWLDATENYGFEFAEDGTVKFPLEFFNLGFEADINGKYVVDKKAETITFTFSAFTLDYSRTYSMIIKGDSLTLTNAKTGKSTIFTKQIETVTSK